MRRTLALLMAPFLTLGAMTPGMAIAEAAPAEETTAVRQERVGAAEETTEGTEPASSADTEESTESASTEAAEGTTAAATEETTAPEKPAEPEETKALWESNEELFGFSQEPGPLEQLRLFNTEHRLEDIFPYADRAVVMDKGRVIADDAPGKVGQLLKVLLTKPRLLLLDEPTKGIDSFFKETFAEILADLKKQGITVVMVSHDVEFCARYADIVSMFFDGQILTTDTPRRFFGANSFYTTAAHRMSRHVFDIAVTVEDVVKLVGENAHA